MRFKIFEFIGELMFKMLKLIIFLCLNIKMDVYVKGLNNWLYEFKLIFCRFLYGGIWLGLNFKIKVIVLL